MTSWGMLGAEWYREIGDEALSKESILTFWYVCMYTYLHTELKRELEGRLRKMLRCCKEKERTFGVLPMRSLFFAIGLRVLFLPLRSNTHSSNVSRIYGLLPFRHTHSIRAWS